MLAFSIAAAAALVSIALYVAVGEGHGKQLTDTVIKIGGYVAIVGLVLGLPALGYAMVTDRAVEKLSDKIGVTGEELRSIGDRIGERIQALLAAQPEEFPEEHSLQVFVPNRQRTHLVPMYDPDKTGPEEGWEIHDDAPQAITGSAWVADKYCYAVHDELRQSGLRLTSEQHKRYEDLTGVAAAPIHKNGVKIGVLTSFTRGDHPQMMDPRFIALHRKLAVALAPVVGDYIPREGALALRSFDIGDAPSHDSGFVN
jgi:hypothetical protein